LSNNFSAYPTAGGNTTPPLSGTSTPTSIANGYSIPATSCDITRLKQSVDRIATSLASIASSMSVDLHRLTNALTGGERKGIVESIKALQSGINLDSDDEDEEDEQEKEVEPPKKKEKTNANKSAGRVQ